jgi:hypothetical protein
MAVYHCLSAQYYFLDTVSFYDLYQGVFLFSNCRVTIYLHFGLSHWSCSRTMGMANFYEPHSGESEKSKDIFNPGLRKRVYWVGLVHLAKCTKLEHATLNTVLPKQI